MSKQKTIQELTNLLAIALRHKIGSIVNENEIYAQKYAKDSEILFSEARKIAMKVNYNFNDKQEIKSILKIRLKKELETRPFINEKKFLIMDNEIEKALKELNLG